MYFIEKSSYDQFQRLHMGLWFLKSQIKHFKNGIKAYFAKIVKNTKLNEIEFFLQKWEKSVLLGRSK